MSEAMIIVTGAGRSGTSAVTGMLHQAGIAAGHALIPGDEMNPDGYFEERAVVQLNDAILSITAVPARFGVATREEIIAAAEPHRAWMQELLRDATPAWKDPRFCWTLEAWLPEFAVQPRVIVCLRSPAEVVASTMRYFGMTSDEDEAAATHTWRTQNERLLEIIDAFDIDAMCVEYGRLLSEPAAVAGDISAFVGRSVKVDGVRRELRHHSAPIAQDLVALYERVRAVGAPTAERAAPSA